MVDLNIVNYIRQLLQSGYDINSIRNQLVSSGYGSNSVNEAVNYVYQKPATEVPAAAAKPGFASHFASRKFLIGIAAVVVVVIASLVLVTLLGGEPTPVEIYLTPSTTQVVQGEDLAFTKSFANIEGSGMLSISYSVVGEITGISAASFQESLSTQVLKRSTQVSIPEGTPPGGYILRATVQYAGQTAEKSFFFTVVAKEETEEVPETLEEPQAGGPDNDNDGTPDAEDIDDDNDGMMDDEDSYPLDHDNDGTPDARDDDSDNDGIFDKYDDYPYDRDNDGIADSADTDNDNDGTPDADDVYPFDYDNDGVQDKDDDATGRSYSFPSAQKEAEFELACSNAIECNDFDICTTDRCMQGTCEYERKTPCCGNFICESGETDAGCPGDCAAAEAEAETEADEIIQEIMQVADTNVESAAARCEQIETASISDECLNQLAQKTGNKVFCERVYTDRIQNSCYLYFAVQGDSSDCPKIEDRLLRNSCYALANMAEIQGQGAP